MVVSFRCPFPGTVLKKSVNITSVMSNLPQTQDSVAMNKVMNQKFDVGN